MPAYLSPLLNDQQADANGAPLSGGKVYTYKAGTSTPIATYTDADGLTPQSNPIVLNSAGRPDSPIWLPAGQAVKLVLKTSADVLVDDWDDVTGINDPSLSNAVDQWVTFSGAPTYISATSFSVVGDQTGVLQVGRRIKTSNTGGTIYSTITGSAYDPGSGLTTLTVANDSGTLDAGLSLVSYGLLSATNPSIPAIKTASTTAAGLVELATDAEAQAGTATDVALTPAAMLSIFAKSLSGNGYIKLPGGPIVQWGTVNVTAGAGQAVVYPVAFTTTSRTVCSLTSPASGGNVGYVNSQTLTGFSANVNGSGASVFTWIAIGY